MNLSNMPATFADYKQDASSWITLASGEYYPDILVDACLLYTPVIEKFGQLLRISATTKELWLNGNSCGSKSKRKEVK